MDNNRNFFDPYSNFGVTPSNVPPAYIPPVPNGEYVGPAAGLKEFYEQQAIYYRYLTTMMEYNLKAREYERQVKQEKSKNT